MTRRLEIVVDELVRPRTLAGGRPRRGGRARSAAARRSPPTLRSRPAHAQRRSAGCPPVTAPAREPAAVGNAVAGAVWSNISEGGKR